MERSKFEEREKTIYLAVLNFEMAKTLVNWIEGPAFLEDSSRLNAYINLAQKAGKGFAVEISQKAVPAGQASDITDEAKKHFNRGAHGSLIFTLPNADERRTSHERALRIKISDSHLSLNSSKGMEACFRREDVLSLEAR